MTETLLSGVSRSRYCYSLSPALLLQLPGQNSRIDDESVAFCPFRGPCPPMCGLKSFHSHSCHSWFCCGSWPWLSCLIQKQTRAKENRLGVYFVHRRLYSGLTDGTHVWARPYLFHTVVKCVCAVAARDMSAFCPQTKVQCRR